jgi:hypothetical protein
MAVAGDPAEKFALALEQPGMISVAQANSRFYERVEHGLQIEGRAADDLEHIGGGSLLLPRFLQFARDEGELLLFGN